MLGALEVLAQHARGAGGVVADGGRVLGEGSAPVHPTAGPGGAVEQDPQELLDSIVAAGRAALDAVITRQAEIIAYIDDFKLMMIITFAILPLLFFMKRGSKADETPLVHMD